MKKILAAAVMVLSFGLAGMASADVQGSTTLLVTATVTSPCTIHTTGVHFGTIDGTSDVNAAGQINVLCADQQAYNVALDKGMHSDSNTGGTIQRYLADGQELNKLQYELYSDAAAGSAIWGDSDFANTYGPGASVAGVGNGLFQALTVYATVKAPASVPHAGTYTDLVGVTVNY